MKNTKHQTNGKHLKELCDVMSNISSNQDMENFLRDICTPAELHAITNRWQVVLMLEDEISHINISDKLRVAIATVTRGSRELQHGHGGFRRALDKLKK